MVVARPAAGRPLAVRMVVPMPLQTRLVAGLAGKVAGLAGKVVGLAGKGVGLGVVLKWAAWLWGDWGLLSISVLVGKLPGSFAHPPKSSNPHQRPS